MRSTKRITRYRRYTTRINLIFAIGFIGSFIWAYADYQIKLQTHPDLPIIGMFFKVQDNTWNKATPFN